MANQRRWLDRITRRDFLQGTLATAALGVGCAHAPPARPWSARREVPGERFRLCHRLPDPGSLQDGELEPHVFDVVIVGAGISGLSAAWALQRQGVSDFVALEKEPVAGGHARAVELAGRRAAAGCAYSLAPWGELLLDFYRDLDLMGPDGPRKELLVPEPANRAFVAGRWVDDAWGAGLARVPFDKAEVQGLLQMRAAMLELAELKTSDGLAPFETPSALASADERVRGLDRQTFAQWARARGFGEGAIRFFDPYCRSALGATAEEISAWALVNFLQAELEPTLTRPGGTAYLAERLAHRIGAQRLRTGRTALRVVERDGLVHVTHAAEDGSDLRTTRARRAVFALPKLMAAPLLPALPAERRASLAGFEYRPFLVANLLVPRVDGGLHYDNWIVPDPGTADERRLTTDVIVADTSAPRGAPGVLTVYCPVLPPFTREQVLREPFDVWAERIVGGLEPALPGLRDQIEQMDLFRWGHALILARPGFAFGPARDAAAPLGAVHFAHTDVDGSPSVEGAVTHGVRAAREAAGALRR